MVCKIVDLLDRTEVYITDLRLSPDESGNRTLPSGATEQATGFIRRVSESVERCYDFTERSSKIVLLGAPLLVQYFLLQQVDTIGG
jgi:hypothetical protein